MKLRFLSLILFTLLLGSCASSRKSKSCNGKSCKDSEREDIRRRCEQLKM